MNTGTSVYSHDNLLSTTLNFLKVNKFLKVLQGGGEEVLLKVHEYVKTPGC